MSHISVTHHMFCVDLTLAYQIVHGQDQYTTVLIVSAVWLLRSIV